MADQRGGGISWTDETWNYLRGCLDDNKDCANCYAKHLAATRLATSPKYLGMAMMTAGGPKWTGLVQMDEGDLLKPLAWSKPRRVFVNAMSDPWYSEVPDDWVDLGFAVMLLADWHTYQVLTKRVERARAYFEAGPWHRIVQRAVDLVKTNQAAAKAAKRGRGGISITSSGPPMFPIEHIWLGASMGHQAAVDEKMPHLTADVFHRTFRTIWVSAEPLLETLDFTPPEFRGTNVNQQNWLQSIDWIVGGGESDRNSGKARPTSLAAARALRDVSINRTDMGRPWPMPFHWKQWGEWSPVTHYQIGGHFLAQNGKVYQTNLLTGTKDGTAARLGVNEAGRILDGRTWDEYPRQSSRAD